MGRSVRQDLGLMSVVSVWLRASFRTRGTAFRLSSAWRRGDSRAARRIRREANPRALVCGYRGYTQGAFMRNSEAWGR
jgi:hypothetical protein